MIMSRSTPVARSRNGRAGVDGPVASESETLVLRATPSIKRYNIARFDLPELPHFSSCAQPVMMYREPERKEEDVSVGYNPALLKRRRRRRKDKRTAGWVIEDSEGNNKFNGTFEGGQSSTYMLLVKNQNNDEFSVMPVEQWFRFKKPLSYRTLTMEEAEEMNNEKKRAVEGWLMKHKLAGEDKADDSGETVSAPPVRTGALAISSSKTKTENDYIFGVAQTARPDVCHVRKLAVKVQRAKMEETLKKNLMMMKVTRKFIMTNHKDLSPIRTKTILKWIRKELAS
ncbi:hypothetical protein PsorP6_005096 [Peronosclerospora sorghi]|uniref:Uncharacterized protein n=1 Tax=Peronosclerospora sorghi TaxID=230839 RepID=A0ACC0W558_9STRA|nr:hypothetical protein PsorP6_005096 [Peronosclerospora sorghi]